jgi:alkylhydroperoxidase family enzyme
MRLRGANLNACTYCATVRLLPVTETVKPKERGLGLIDVSGLTKAEAVAALKDRLQTNLFTPREVAALSLVDRIIVDPHSLDDRLFAELRQHFTDDAIIELICASSLFTWAGTLNTALRVETGAEGMYGGGLAYATAQA